MLLDRWRLNERIVKGWSVLVFGNVKVFFWIYFWDYFFVFFVIKGLCYSEKG